MKRGFDLLAAHKGIALDLATIPTEDPRTYAMIRRNLAADGADLGDRHVFALEGR